MRWTVARAEIWIEYYKPLSEYELEPWSEIDEYAGERIIRGKGSRFRAPFEMQAILNAEFDLAIKSLGDLGEKVFRLCILDKLDIEEAIKKIDGYTVKRIKDKRRSVKRDLINWLLESER